jgi:hypothetical protein
MPGLFSKPHSAQISAVALGSCEAVGVAAKDVPQALQNCASSRLSAWQVAQVFAIRGLG